MKALQKRFESLTHLLGRGRTLWAPLPFKHRVLPWQREFPALASKLESLPDQTVSLLEQDFGLLRDFLNPFIEDASELWELCQFPATCPPHEYSPTPPVAVPGRKWEQIRHFLYPPPKSRGPFIEWCSGKGHLARALCTTTGYEVRCLEHDPILCSKGELLAASEKVSVDFSCVDVLQDHPLNPRDRVLALHACGDLHRHLLKQAVSNPIDYVRYSPCCYHRSLSEHYTPLSQTGRNGPPLTLLTSDLRLAVHETITAPLHDRRKRVQNSAWRLGFDLLLRNLTGRREYTSLPSFRNGELSLTFPRFCEVLCHQLGVTLPDNIELSEYLQKGQRRHLEVTRADLVRHLYRRPLETWLVLDGALFLAENGFKVQIHAFCPRQISPRNLRVEARRLD